MYTVPNQDGAGRRALSNREISKAVHEIYEGLRGQYIDINGATKAVNGDYSRLRHLKTPLSAAALCLLDNMAARSQNIAGTQDVRRKMRLQTAPSERDATLMMKLARARECDPALISDPTAKFQTRDLPPTDVEFFSLDPD